MKTIGNLYEIQGEIQFEWEIENFLRLEDKSHKGYKSPEFSFYGVTWVVEIYPYGGEKNGIDKWIDLHIKPTSLQKSITIDVSFSIKTIDEKSDLEKKYTFFFFREQLGFGFNNFILRSDLIKRKAKLLPSGDLTVICTLKNTEADDDTVNAPLHVFTQTEEIVSTSLEASTQTDEETGVWKLQQHLHEISLNGDISDVILRVKDEEFKSHKCILAARSPVFSAMMKNDMKENATGIVDILDVDPNTFSDFLSYLYTGNTKYLTSENVAKLYIAADKYEVEVLKQDCLNLMLINVSIDNFCEIFMLSVQHNEEKLKQTCIQYFGKHLLDIIKTCKWQSFLCENPIICNELHIKHMELCKNIGILHCKGSQK